MKALVWKGGNDFEVEQAPDPRAEPGRLVVKVEYAAVCGSDFHLADFGARPPLIPGHEASGTVVEVGAGVKGVKPGDRVALNPVQSCGTCASCLRGRRHLCAHCRHLGDRETPGAWAEYVAIDAVNAHAVPEGVDLLAAALTEPAAVCHESFRRAGGETIRTALIIGDGPFGFLHAQMARTFGAETIIVAGHYPGRLQRIAARTGAITCNTRDQDLTAVVREALAGGELDIAIEATGAGASPDLGIDLLRPRGVLVIFSYIWKPQPLNMGLIHMKELNVLGACRSLDAFDPCLELMRQGKLDTAVLADVLVPFEDYPVAMAQLRERKEQVFKAVFTPEAVRKR